MTKQAKVVDDSDPRFVPVAAAFVRTPGFSLMESKSGGSRGLMQHGKSFGMCQHGRLILKLDDARVAALVAASVGTPFSPSVGRIMKGWIEVTDAQADWVALAKTAHAIAAAAGAPAGKTAAKAGAKPKAPAKKSAPVKRAAPTKKRAKR